jgi:hypothetical protein
VSASYLLRAPIYKQIAVKRKKTAKDIRRGERIST